MLEAKNVLIRAISGGIYVAIIIFSLILGGGWLFLPLCVVMGIWAILEFNNMWSYPLGRPCENTENAIDVFGIFCLTAILPLLDLSKVFPQLSPLPIIIIVLYVGYILGRMIMAIYDKRQGALIGVAGSFMSQLYIGGGLIGTQYLCIISPGFVLLAFIYIWLNDTGAFLSGSLFGKHKMFPRLSPKKSWEGFMGGIVICSIVALIFNLTGIDIQLIGQNYFVLCYPEFALIFPVVICSFATLGDLFESLLKRSTGVKDSGHSIPGHGGLLDRIDSMLFVMPGLIVAIFLFNLFR